jgi:hypothetical protein
LAEILPTEQADYFEAINAKHFVPETGVGSLFTECKNLEELLILAQQQRGSLAGDDRDKFLQLGVPNNALLPECRYLLIETAGEIGIVSINDPRLKPETEVSVERRKPNAPCSLIVSLNEFPRTTLGTIVIGPNEKFDHNSPEPSTKEMVRTAHPGLPIRPATTDIWAENSKITIADVRAKLGENAFLNVRREMVF